MLKEARSNLSALSFSEFQTVATELCCSSIEVFPIYECVKVFARLTDNNTVTYARHPNDLGTDEVSLYEVSARMKDPSRVEVVETALTKFEKVMKPVWPFSPGSTTWLQLEITHPTIRSKAPPNAPGIIIRKACRLRLKSGKVISESSPVVKRIFSQFEQRCPLTAEGFQIACNPRQVLKNISGHGVLTECLNTASEVSVSSATTILTQAILRENNILDISPGFFFEFEGKNIRVASDKYLNTPAPESRGSADRLPIPIAGWIK